MIDQCGPFANEPTVGAGYFREQFPDGSYSPWYAGHYSWWPEEETAENRRNLGSPRCPDQCFGDPINAGNGNKFESKIEFQGGAGSPLEFSWTYNSFSDFKLFPPGVLIVGRHRTHNYSRRISYFPDASATPTAYLLRPDGKALRFIKVGNAWEGDSNEPGSLHSVEALGNIQNWSYRDDTGGTEQYDSDGRLTRLIDRDGRIQNLTYKASGALSKVSDESHRTLTFNYNVAGLLGNI